MPGGSKRSRAGWVVVAAIFVVSSVVAFRAVDIPDTAFFGGDTWEYQSMAVNFAHGHGLRLGAIDPWEEYRFEEPILPEYSSTYETLIELGARGGEDDFYRTPAYPFLLGLLYKIVGVRPDIAMAVQMFVMIAIGSLLPVIGERLLGPRGFVAGIPAGLLLATVASRDAVAIMTETLIAFACVVVLLAWVALAKNPGWLSGLAFGLALAFALLVKGSLIFLPPLFIGYMVIRDARSGRFPARSIAAVVVGMAIPVLAYSTWASIRADQPIFLTTQGRMVLLDGHNEYVAATGSWSPQWRNEPGSFHNRLLRSDPDLRSGALITRFYLADPSLLPRIALAKIRKAGEGEPLQRNGTALMLGALLLHLSLLAVRDAGPLIRFVTGLSVIALVVATWGDAATSLTGAVVVGLAGLRSPRFRTHVGSTWANAPLMGLTLLLVNFLLLAVATFGFPRFNWPALFAILLAAGYLSIRAMETLDILPGLPLLPAAGRDRSLVGAIYSRLRASVYGSVAREIDLAARYVNTLLYTGSSDDAHLFERLHAADKRLLRSLAPEDLPTPATDEYRLFVLNGTFNTSLDIQALLSGARRRMSRRDRIAVVLYNPYLRWLWIMLDRAGLRSAPPATTFVTRRSLESLATLSGFQLVRLRPASNFPFRVLGIGTALDGLMKSLPLVRLAAPVNVAFLRPVIPETARPSLSVIIPARNERGNVGAAIERMPLLPGVETEVIFVEGGSTDDTAGEIRRVIEAYSGPLRLRSLTQSGRGKGDAVRLGFAHATGDLVTILDADLTMPPEMLPRFYDAWCQGLGDFVNGNRLLYPMEGEAMRFLNTLGNVFFCKSLAWILESPLGDTLCGTKLLSRRDWNRVIAWREDFGDFDPFGDFELLFSAATMSLGIVEVPVHYRARTYGETNIHRFRHGLMLAKMSLIGLVRIRMGLGSPAGRR